jgi:hypothetical protein
MNTSINKLKKRTYIEDLKTVIKTISDELNTSVNEDSMDKTQHGSQTIFLNPPEVFIKVYQDKSPFCLGTQEKTLDKRVVNYIGRSYDLLVGFIDITFELWLGDVLQNVYNIPRNTFVPLTNTTGHIIMIVILNCHKTAVTIKNIVSSENEASILQIGATLSWELRSETLANKCIIL